MYGISGDLGDFPRPARVGKSNRAVGPQAATQSTRIIIGLSSERSIERPSERSLDGKKDFVVHPTGVEPARPWIGQQALDLSCLPFHHECGGTEGEIRTLMASRPIDFESIMYSVPSLRLERVNARPNRYLVWLVLRPGFEPGRPLRATRPSTSRVYLVSPSERSRSLYLRGRTSWTRTRDLCLIRTPL